jgi:uncharacterized protein
VRKPPLSPKRRLSLFYALACCSTATDIAAKLAAQRNVTLSASDALHLAVSEETRTELITLDHRMAEAGAALEIPARLI